MHATAQPYARARGEGHKRWFLGPRPPVVLTGEQTSGAFGLIEQALSAGSTSPWHLHHDEDVARLVLEGEVAFRCGDQRVRCGAGTYVWGPRGIAHGFRVEGQQPARILLLNTPAGFEHFIIELSEPAEGQRLPPPGPPDMQKLMAVAATYNIRIFGPLPA